MPFSTAGFNSAGGDELTASEESFVQSGTALPDSPVGNVLKKAAGALANTVDQTGAATPSATVVSETAFGQASTAGVSTDYSRGDHTHGTPTNPVTAHEAAATAHAAATNLEKTANKGAASGYASLDGTTKVPTAELGTGVASAATFLRGDRSWQAVSSTNTLALVYLGL